MFNIFKKSQLSNYFYCLKVITLYPARNFIIASNLQSLAKQKKSFFLKTEKAEQNESN